MNGNEGESNMVDDENNVVYAPKEYNIKLTKWRVREGFPVTTSQVIFLYEICDSDNKEVKRFKAHKNGVVKKRLYEDGMVIEKGAPVLELCECIHATVIKDMCADCGADLRQNENGYSEASVPMVHSVPDLKVTQKIALQLGQADTNRLLEDRKLVLLVDLDQTLIHTTNDNVPNNIKGIYHFQLYGPKSPWYHTKLRPCTKEFLNNIAPYFELHICTFGARNYAHMIAQLIDPDGKFFSHRILSRDECFNVTYKTDNLKALFPCGDAMVCIIDDREDVWNMASNLIQVKPYHFFQHSGDINAPPGLSKHELDGKGVDFKDLKLPSKVATSKEDNTKYKKDEKHGEQQIGNVTEEKAEKNSEIVEDKIEKNKKEEAQKKNDENQPTSDSTEKIEVSNMENVRADVDVTTKNNETCDEVHPNTENQPQQEKKSENVEKKKIEDKIESNAPESKNEPIAPENKNEFVAPENKNELTEPGNKNDKMELKENEFIEIEDADDYLLYLETILTTIHKRFYEIYDQQNVIPDLKILIPQIRSRVLEGLNLVFSGLVPNQMKLEQSRAYLIARSLGANVSQYITNKTTHLVAATVGTFKYNAARKRKDILIVTPDWLWCCAERWERVDEKLFPLDAQKPSKMRQPPAHCHSPEHVINYNELTPILPQEKPVKPEPKFIDTINPLLSFSNADLAEMNQEFDQFFESDSSSEDEHVNIEIPPMDKTLLKRKREENDEDRQRKFFSRTDDNTLIVENEEQDNDNENQEENDENSSDDEPPSVKFRRGENLPSDLDIGSEESLGSDDELDDEDDGEWNMMGAALEREFLGLEK